MQPTLLTTAEVAGRLRVSIPTVNRWVRDGRLTPVQKLPGIRGANLFDPSDIDTLNAEVEQYGIGMIRAAEIILGEVRDGE